jgi:hypothetical protein
MLRAAEERQLFRGEVPKQLRRMEAFSTRHMAIAAQDETADLSSTAAVLQEAFGIPADSISSQDRKEVMPMGCFSGHLLLLTGLCLLFSLVLTPLQARYWLADHASCMPGKLLLSNQNVGEI